MSRLFAPPPHLIGKSVLRVYRVPFSTRSSRFPPWIIFFTSPIPVHSTHPHTTRCSPSKHARPTPSKGRSGCSSCLSAGAPAARRGSRQTLGVLCVTFRLLSCPRYRWQSLCSHSHLLLASIPQVPTHVRRLWLHFTSVTGSVSQKKD